MADANADRSCGPAIGIGTQHGYAFGRDAGNFLQPTDNDLQMLRELTGSRAAAASSFNSERSSAEVFSHQRLKPRLYTLYSPSFSSCRRARWTARIIWASALALSGEIAWSFRK